MMPKTSVIIPTFNRADFLERAIRSVLSQTYRGFEIIIIDDASTDNTQEMLKEHFSQEINAGLIRCIRNETNIERSRSRNKGMEAARGDYIALLDDDDTWLPGHLKLLVHYLDGNKDVGCVFSNPVFLYVNGSAEVRLQGLKSGKGTLYRNLSVEGKLILHSIHLFRKEVSDNIGGFREDMNFGEDWEFFSRVAMNYSIGYIETISSCIYIHSGSYSNKSSKEYAYAREKIWDIIEQNSANYGFCLSNELLGKVYLKMGRDFIPVMQKAREYIFKAIKENGKLLVKPDTWGLLGRILLSQKTYLYLRKRRKRG